MGKDAAGLIPFFWDAPKESNPHPGVQSSGNSVRTQRPPQHNARAGTGGFMAELFPQLQEL